MNKRFGKLSVRLQWRQVGVWWGLAGERVLFNWLNPLVWCWHGNGLHLRGQPIELVELVELVEAVHPVNDHR